MVKYIAPSVWLTTTSVSGSGVRLRNSSFVALYVAPFGSMWIAYIVPNVQSQMKSAFWYFAGNFAP